jgi:hypothetical protein
MAGKSIESKALSCLERNGVKLVSSIRSLIFEVEGKINTETGKRDSYDVFLKEGEYSCSCKAGTFGNLCYHVRACQLYCERNNIKWQ